MCRRTLTRSWAEKAVLHWAVWCALVRSAAQTASWWLLRAPNYLDQVAEWISRLDTMAENGSDEQMFVYRVRNGEAANLADLLSQLFDSKGSSTSKTKQASVAPGLTPRETVPQRECPITKNPLPGKRPRRWQKPAARRRRRHRGRWSPISGSSRTRTITPC